MIHIKQHLENESSANSVFSNYNHSLSGHVINLLSLKKKVRITHTVLKMQCQLFRTETSKAVLELSYHYICVKAGTAGLWSTATIGLVLLVRWAIIYETEPQIQPII